MLEFEFALDFQFSFDVCCGWNLLGDQKPEKENLGRDRGSLNWMQ
jgi:hypothetical protein